MSRRWFFSFLLAFGVVLLVFSFVFRDRDPAGVSVLVEDGESGRSLVGVSVEASFPAPLGVVSSAETDDSGRVFFNNLSPGTVTFGVSFVDFRDFFQTLEIKRGKNEEVLFSLDLVTAPVRGRVLDSFSGDPIAGAEVAAGGVMAETSADGRFALDEVVIGTPAFRVRKDGYEELSLNVSLIKGVTRDLGDLPLTEAGY
jgi:hypothetical protein